jgi:hypothetical protein
VATHHREGEPRVAGTDAVTLDEDDREAAACELEGDARAEETGSHHDRVGSLAHGAIIIGWPLELDGKGSFALRVKGSRRSEVRA